MPTHRNVRIDGEFKRAISEIVMTQMKDSRISQMIGITRVNVTNDLSHAKVYVSVYDTDVKKESTIEALEHGEGFIRAKLNDMIKLRRIPHLHFVLDSSVEYSVNISKLIDEVNKNV